VIRLEAGIAGYAGKSNQTYARSEYGHRNLNAPHASLTLLSLNVVRNFRMD
jgi:hypothetical protein